MSEAGVSGQRAGDERSGLFGPGSVTWRLHADPLMGLAGLRALLLQALHPVAMHAVETASDYRADPWGRLRRTADYIGVTSYGTVTEARAAAEHVRAVHRRVGGVEPVTGRHYRADDADLLLWVHVGLVDSVLSTLRRAGVVLTRADADRYVAEQVRGAALLGVPERLVPADTTGLAASIAAARVQLAATPAARAAARFLLVPPMPPAVALATPARPAWAGVAGLAFALLPRWARRMCRLPGLPVTDISATLAARVLRTGLLAVPPGVREGPHVTAARHRLEALA